MSDDTTETATETDEKQVDESTETQTDETNTDNADALGDAGKKALDAMKAERNAAKADARAKATELEQLRQQIALKDKPAEEQAIEAAKAEARTEATQAANERILKSELKAAAKGVLADPTDAALYINLSDFTVDENGDVDSDALNEAIAELIERKPHLAAVKQNRFDGAADQGAKGKDSTPPQWTEDDLARATDDETVAAKAAGKLNNLLGIKH